MEFLDLFSGIGGFRRGLERSGHNVLDMWKLINMQTKAIWLCMDCRIVNMDNVTKITAVRSAKRR